jgi:hypothetical protein
MNQYERRAFDREGRIAKVSIVVLLLILAAVAGWLFWFFEHAPFTGPYPPG